jgi:hypothetical protein
MPMILRFLCLAFAWSTLTTATGHAQTPDNVWMRVLRQCGDLGSLQNDFIYFGVSNSLGPGSVWRQKQDGSWQPRAMLSNLTTNEKALSQILVKGKPASCNGKSSFEWKLSPSLALSSRVSPLNAEISASLNKAKAVTVSIKNWRIDELIEAPFEAEVFKRQVTDIYRREVFNVNHVLMTRGVWVSGMTATLTFSKEDAAQAKASIGKSILGGTASVDLNAKYTADDTITFESGDGFYLIGMPSKFTKNGVAITGADYRFLPVKVSDPDQKLAAWSDILQD